MKKRTIFTCLLLISSFSIASSYAEKVNQNLQNPLLHQPLINQVNFDLLNKLSQNYPKQNTLNAAWLSVFRRYNSGETVQNRTALNARRSHKELIFDLDQDQPLDWRKVKINSDNEPSFSAAQTSVYLNTTNIEKKEAPLVLILLSNQHTLIDYISNPAVNELTRLGVIVSALEYPNYGVSLGRASLQSWLSASRGAVRFLNQLTGKKIIIVGHSIGGPLALQAAADQSVQNMILSTISYGGFSNLYDMSKDQQSNPFIKFFSKQVTYLTLKDNIIDGVSNIEALAKMNIPVLILHGIHDGAVPPRHLNIYQNKIKQVLDETQSTTPMRTVLFDTLYHEEVNNFVDFKSQDFHLVWNEILSFTRELRSLNNINTP